MFKWSKGYFVVFVVLVVLLLGGTVGTGFVFARGSAKALTSTTASNLPVSAKPISERMVAMHTLDETKVPRAPGRPGSTHPKVIPFRTGVSPAVFAQRKAAAAHNHNAPTANASFVPTNGRTASPNTPTASTSFPGLSASNCFGCEPPDMALAASPSFVMQGVNTSFAVFNTSGTLKAGWPT